jgi:Zn-dependent protease
MGSLSDWLPSWSNLLLLPAVFVGFTVHELAHALVAYLLGDTSQVERKRLSFNPLRHISWLGMILFLVAGFGWAKPVMVDWTRLRIKNRAFGMFLVSIAGAAANLLLALVAGIGTSLTMFLVSGVTGAGLGEVLRFLVVPQPAFSQQGVAVALSGYMVSVNLILAFFNLLPIPMFDGFQALMSLVSLVRGALRGSQAGAPTARAAAPAAGAGGPARSPAEIHFGIGLEYHQAGELDEAIARYRQALAYDERFGLAYYNLGLAYLAKGRLPLASGAFRAVLQSHADPGLHLLADARLRELARAEQDPTFEQEPVPEPLAPGGEIPRPTSSAPPLDPEVARRLWLRLAVSAGVSLALAVAAWVFVTLVTIQAFG